MIFDRECEIDLGLDRDTDFDVEYEPIGELELEVELVHEQQGVDELLRACELAGGSDRRAERSEGETGTTSEVFAMIRSRSAGETETPENPGGTGGSLLVRSPSRQAPPAAAREERLARAERSEGETGTTSEVFAMIRSRSGTEASTPENPGGTGGSLVVQSPSREALPVAEREMKKSSAARAHALRSTGSDDPTGGHSV